jgi:hypothetical protein
VANDKAMNALFLAISQTEHSRISNCDSAKDAWEILETTYEGTNLVKATKLQMLVSKFERIEMLEDETFDDFFGKLSEIRNSMINLGKKVSDTKIVRKVMRSLPDRFKMKVTAIESCTDLETLRIEELVGALQTYEFSLSKPRKNKDLALRTLRKNSDESSDEEPDDEKIALVARKYHNIRHQFPKRLEKLEESYKDRNERDPRGRKCYECSGYGHLRKDCANHSQGPKQNLKIFCFGPRGWPAPYGFAGHPSFFLNLIFFFFWPLGVAMGVANLGWLKPPLGSSGVAGHPLWVCRPPSFFFFF